MQNKVTKYNLVVDLGNSNIVFGIFDRHELVAKFRLVTNKSADIKHYIAEIDGNLAEINVSEVQIKASVIASVVPELTDVLASVVKARFKTQSHILKTGDLPIKLDIDEPTQLGMDRYINSWWATLKYGANCIIIDFGTATTFEVIHNGIFIGGVIAPGLHLSHKALVMAASKLESVDIVRPGKVIGKNTETNVQSGLIFGYVGMVEGMIKRIKEELHEDFDLGKKETIKVIATGGLGEMFAAEVEYIDTYDPDLTIEGLNEFLIQF